MQVCALTSKEGPEGVKRDLGIAYFVLGKERFYAGTGIHWPNKILLEAVKRSITVLQLTITKSKINWN